MKIVTFEVVEIWYNNIYTPFTLNPMSDKSQKEYAIKIGDDFFHLGQAGAGVRISDFPEHFNDWKNK